LERVTNPYFCPYCGGTKLIEDEPTEIEFDNEIWTVYRWICEECGEYFNKVIITEEDTDSDIYWE